MARTADEIMEEIIKVRSWNKAVYEKMEDIEPQRIFDDNTCEIVRRAYLKNPIAALSLHERAHAYDDRINVLTAEYIEAQRAALKCE